MQVSVVKIFLITCIFIFVIVFDIACDTKQANILFRAQTNQEAFSFVLYLIKKLSWFENNGYIVGLPKHTAFKILYDNRDSIANVTECELERIKHIFNKEIYNYQDFHLGLQLLQVYNEILVTVISRLHELHNQWDFRLMKHYEVVLTLYGPGGNYHFKDETGYIIMKIDQKINSDGTLKSSTLGTIIHEMVHIGIEEFVQEYKLTHWEKERIVDLICYNCFSDIIPEYHMQKKADTKVDAFITAEAIKLNLVGAIAKLVAAYPRRVNSLYKISYNNL